MKPYDPQIGEIWYFGNTKKHYLIVDRKECEAHYASYKWRYELLCLENGSREYTMYGTMNAYGEGWYRKVS